jgi:hypothetical protein
MHPDHSTSSPESLPQPPAAPTGGFWDTGPEFDSVQTRIEPPETPFALLKQLGPSPFERGRFPLIGFLATVYDKVTRRALDRK